MRSDRSCGWAVVLAVFAAGSACSKQTDAAETFPQGDPALAPISAFPCVRFEDLQRHLPKEVAGYESSSDEGSSGKYGEVSISEAERVFTGADGEELSIRIVDTTMAEDLGRAIRAAAHDASRKRKDDPTAPIISQGTVGFVRYDEQNRRAEANMLVADRFVVAVNSRNVDGTGLVRKVAHQMDLTALALLR